MTAAMRVAMLGTRGVPARYGGFETCVEEVGQRLVARGHHVTVYGRGSHGDTPREHLGMQVVTLPAIHHRAVETLSHTALSVAHLLARRRPDAALLFNAANAPFIPALRARSIPVATHVDGLEWKRAKWGRRGQRYYRWAESQAVRWSDALIADARGIADYYATTYDAATRLITYGAPAPTGSPERLGELGLEPGGYHLVVARFEPENHVAEVVEGYVASAGRLPLVVVGSAPYSAAYTARIRASADSSVRFLGSVWDSELLDQLYAGAYVYWHGHSVGGTNPSLLRALGAGTASNAYDVGFNREVLRDSGRYWADAAGVARLVDEAEAEPESVRHRAGVAAEEARRYDWEQVTDEYERLCADLASGRASRASAPPTAHPSRDAAAAPPAAVELQLAVSPPVDAPTAVPVESR